MGDEDGTVRSMWRRRATLNDSRWDTNDVRFAPRHLELKFAAAGADGCIRVYEATNPLDPTHWELTEFKASASSVTCLTWNQSRFDAPMLAVGGEDPVIRIFAYDASRRVWDAIAALAGHTAGVHDVAWAPNLGRSFHNIASASKDGTVRVWRVSADGEDEPEDAMALAAAGGAPPTRGDGPTGVTVDMAVSLDDHHSEVWRVQWNALGTVLVSSGDDNRVRMWRQTLRGDWKGVGEVVAASDADDAAGTSSRGAAATAAGADAAGAAAADAVGAAAAGGHAQAGLTHSGAYVLGMAAANGGAGSSLPMPMGMGGP